MALLRPMIALAAIALFLVPVASAGAAACGDVITQDATLDSDLLGCTGPALIVTGDGVELDLSGHTVQGGVFLNEATGPVVENGTVEGRTGNHGLRQLGQAQRRLAPVRERVLRQEGKA